MINNRDVDDRAGTHVAGSTPSSCIAVDVPRGLWIPRDHRPVAGQFAEKHSPAILSWAA
jgi:hypothetical protein